MPVVPIVARAVLALLQVPPLVPSVKVVVAPKHTEDAPEIAAGAGLTVNETVSPLNGKLLQFVAFVTKLMTAVVNPALVIATVLKVPTPETMFSVVVAIALFAPLRV